MLGIYKNNCHSFKKCVIYELSCLCNVKELYQFVLILNCWSHVERTTNKFYQFLKVAIS